jgi:AcrR family transcriptional regulator
VTIRGRKLLSRPERQEVILRGAATAFATKGFAGTSMEEVAAASGITKEIVYRNFDSKEELYRAVLERTVERIRSEFSQLTHESRSGLGIRAILAAGRAHPDALRLLLVHAAREPQFADYAREVRKRHVERVMRRHPYPDPICHRWAAEVVTSHVWDAVLTWLDIGDPARDEEFAQRCASGVEALHAAWTTPPDP